MLDRLVGLCLALLAAALALYVAVRLIESVATGLFGIGAVIGAGSIASLVWRRRRSDRW